MRDLGQMLAYLLFLQRDKPAFGKYNFEQKVTYWVVFFSIAVMSRLVPMDMAISCRISNW